MIKLLKYSKGLIIELLKAGLGTGKKKDPGVIWYIYLSYENTRDL